MASFTEALRLVIDADTGKAVAEVKRFGDATARELGKSEKSLDKWGSRLSNVGVGMVAFGAAAVAGLGALAMESEKANLSQVKLQNTIDNMPRLAGATASEFTDLADSIQDVTAADADAIVEAEALLGTFKLTADQIKTITPLVVDYARKFGIDMADAAVQVGKALDGQVGALKRNGVSIDETLFKTDRYRAVQEALSEQVGGFAEAEGKTFAGSLERMKNQLGDLAEGVGGGAVDAFTTMFSAVDKVAGAFESISPGAQNLIGQIATFGAVALIAVGGVTTLIGQVIKAREAFITAATAMRAYSAAFITVGQVGAVIGALIAVRHILGTIDDEISKTGISKLENQLLDLADTGKASGETLQRVFAGIGEGGFFDTSIKDTRQLRSDIGQLDEALAKLATRDPSAATEAFARISEELQSQGASAADVTRLFDNYAAALAEGDTANRTTGEAVAEATGEFDEQTEAVEDTTSALEDYANKLAAQFDPLFGMVSALQSSRDAAQQVAEAQQALNEAMAGGDADAIAEAQRNYDDALSGSSESLFRVQQAQLVLNDAIARGDVSLEDAQTQMFDWAVQAGYTAEQALAMAGQLGGAADEAAGLAAKSPVNVLVSLSGVTAATADIANLKARLDSIPRTVQSEIITTFHSVFGGPPNPRGRQHGGPVRAGEAYIVGEKHEELFIPNENGTVLPDVPQFVPPRTGVSLNGAGAATGGGGGTVTLVIDSGSNPVDRVLADILRRTIRLEHGGNVQAALGFSR